MSMSAGIPTGSSHCKPCWWGGLIRALLRAGECGYSSEKETDFKLRKREDPNNKHPGKMDGLLSPSAIPCPSSTLYSTSVGLLCPKRLSMLLILTWFHPGAQECVCGRLHCIKDSSKLPFSHATPWSWAVFFTLGCPHLLVSHKPLNEGSLMERIPAVTVPYSAVPWMSLPCCQWLYWWFQEAVGKIPSKSSCQGLSNGFMSFKGL